MYADDKLAVQKTLRKMYPAKCTDAEWGTQWEGPIFGVHVGHGGSAGRLKVGSRVTLSPTTSLVFLHAVLRAMLGPYALIILPIMVLVVSLAVSWGGIIPL